MPIELNDEFKLALGLMEKTKEHLFITGRAGTGKSTLLDYFRSGATKQLVVLAPTGVAALNVKGQTIHSFFRFKPDITPEKVKKLHPNKSKIYKNLEAIIIDEISMVRADLLDCVDKFLRLHGPHSGQPFGGCQMIFIGDLYQLPPVVSGAERNVFRVHYPSPYFFDAKVLVSLPLRMVELEKVYRQKDQSFIDLLNTVRNNSATDLELAALNSRCLPDFEPPSNEFYITTTSTNDQAAQINHLYLAKLSGKARSFPGLVAGEFSAKDLPTEINLSLKSGAQVMFLNNDSRGRWVNGSIGRVVKIERDTETGQPAIISQLAQGDKVKVLPYTWEIFHFRFNERQKILESEVVGSFTQYPLRLAWAVTIHKSQGKTFDKLIVDVGRGTFAHGQMYVALSRCTSLAGLVLKKPIHKNHIFMDWRVVRFLTGYQYQRSESTLPVAEKIKLIQRAIANRSKLEIIYLKSSDVKSKRVIQPASIGQMDYLGKPFLGLTGFCFSRQADRVFRVDKILEIKETVDKA